MLSHETDCGFQLLSNPDLARTADDEWNARFGDYVTRASLAHADRKFGAFARADELFDREQHQLCERYGAKPWGAEEEAESKAVMARLSKAEEIRLSRFVEPYWRAAAALVMTPAPNMVAALFKVALAQHEQLDNDPYMTREPMEILLEDVARLTCDPTLARMEAGVLSDLRGATQRLLAEAAGQA